MNKTRVALVVPKVKEVSPKAIPYRLASIAGYILEHCENIEVKIIDETINDKSYSELNQLIHMFKLVYRILEIKNERKDILKC